jgi:hypothetical protein
MEQSKASSPDCNFRYKLRKRWKGTLRLQKNIPMQECMALMGGRILFGEGLSDAIRRISSEYGMKVDKAYLGWNWA